MGLWANDCLGCVYRTQQSKAAGKENLTEKVPTASTADDAHEKQPKQPARRNSKRGHKREGSNSSNNGGGGGGSERKRENTQVRWVTQAAAHPPLTARGVMDARGKYTSNSGGR